jgi:hypothetical protein
VLKDSTQPYYFQITSASVKGLIDASAPDQLLASTASPQDKQPETKSGVKKSARTSSAKTRTNKAPT